MSTRNINEAIWRQAFPDDDESDQQIKKLKQAMEKFFIPDNIAPQHFLNNYETLSSRSVFPKQLATTKNLKHFINIAGRPLGLPLWFIAAYPDISFWLQSDEINSEDFWAKLAAKAFGEKHPDDFQFKDEEGCLREELLRALIDTFKEKQRVKLECQCGEDELQSKETFDVLSEAMGGGDNFQIIARNTAKFYKILKSQYQGQFNGETSLLATTGILDAQHHIFIDKKINPNEIILLAKKITDASENPLLDFIVELEILLFSKEASDFNEDEIRESCESKKSKIEAEIKKVFEDKSPNNPMLEKSAVRLMTEGRFNGLRTTLGIKETTPEASKINKKNQSRVCPSCQEKNNPMFTHCWKCGSDFATGKMPTQQPQGAGGVGSN